MYSPSNDVRDVMIRQASTPLSVSLASLIGMASLLLGCEVGGVGDPCIPEDEYTDTFSGFSVEEVNVESRSFQCLTRICLVNHFQGRVSCPYGNTMSEGNTRYMETPPQCHIPDNANREIKVAVDPQLAKRTTSTAVYCSCRCDGPDPNARYCECPSGFACRPLVDDLKLGSAQLVGNYCIREGTEYDRSIPRDNTCRYSTTQSGQGCPATGCVSNDPTENGFCGKVDPTSGAPL
jgi:hypothetical protein